MSNVQFSLVNFHVFFFFGLRLLVAISLILIIIVVKNLVFNVQRN